MIIGKTHIHQILSWYKVIGFRTFEKYDGKILCQTVKCRFWYLFMLITLQIENLTINAINDPVLYPENLPAW